jgi:hypothetical protein
VSDAGRTSLQALAAATVSALTDVAATEAAAATDAAAATEWSRAGIPFAMIDRDTLEVRLAPAVAGAALRTPDTTQSTRGREWVRFTPVVLDQYAVDRATAWIESAWRNAAS